MKPEKIFMQLHNNAIAILSLIIAITALCYTAWREEKTETNRTLRVASFEVLKNLGELQLVVNNSHYGSNSPMGNPFLGWGHIAIIGDLSKLLPAPLPDSSERLIHVWKENWQKIQTDEQSVDDITAQIDENRKNVLWVINQLN